MKRLIMGLVLMLVFPVAATAEKKPPPMQVKIGSGELKFKDNRTGLQFNVPLDYEAKLIKATKKRQAEMRLTHKTVALQLRIRMDKVPKDQLNLPNLKLFTLTTAVNRAAAFSGYQVLNLPPKVLKKFGADLGVMSQYLRKNQKLFCCEEIWVVQKKSGVRYTISWLYGKDQKKSRKRRQLARKFYESWDW